MDSAEFFCFYLLQIKGLKTLFTLLAATIVIKIYRTHKINHIKNTPQVSLLIYLWGAGHECLFIIEYLGIFHLYNDPPELRLALS